MQPLGSKNMQEDLEYDETSVQNETQKIKPSKKKMIIKAPRPKMKQTLQTYSSVQNSSIQDKVTTSVFPSSSIVKNDHERNQFNEN